MTIILKWEYQKGTDDILDALNSVDSFGSVADLAETTGLSQSTLKRRLKSLEDDGLLVRHRYKNNNFIWMIGEDARRRWNKWEADQIARYRLYIGIYGGSKSEFDECTDEEKENILIDVPLFDSEKDELFSDNGVNYFGRANKLLKAEGVPETKELTEYIDKLWELYTSRANDSALQLKR